MEYAEFHDQLKESVYAQIPRGSDAWGYDVWERAVRPQFADAHKKVLRKLRTDDAANDAERGIVERVRLDLFGVRPDGKSAGRIPDDRDALVTDLLPPLESADADDVVRALEWCRSHAAYKLHKWGVLTQLASLVDLCERIPDFRVPEYAEHLQGTAVLAGHSAAVMSCDIDTKPNFASLPDKAKLYRATYALGERVWEVIGRAG